MKTLPFKKTFVLYALGLASCATASSALAQEDRARDASMEQARTEAQERMREEVQTRERDRESDDRDGVRDRDMARERTRDEDQVRERDRASDDDYRTRDREMDRERHETQERIGDEAQARARDRIYGSQLMTEEEREHYRQRMRAATSEEERQKIRSEHHAQMVERARERGVTLPDEPPQRPGMSDDGRGGGHRMGMGGGAGLAVAWAVAWAVAVVDADAETRRSRGASVRDRHLLQRRRDQPDARPPGGAAGERPPSMLRHASLARRKRSWRAGKHPKIAAAIAGSPRAGACDVVSLPRAGPQVSVAAPASGIGGHTSSADGQAEPGRQSVVG